MYDIVKDEAKLRNVINSLTSIRQVPAVKKYVELYNAKYQNKQHEQIFEIYLKSKIKELKQSY